MTLSKITKAYYDFVAKNIEPIQWVFYFSTLLNNNFLRNCFSFTIKLELEKKSKHLSKLPFFKLPKYLQMWGIYSIWT